MNMKAVNTLCFQLRLYPDMKIHPKPIILSLLGSLLLIAGLSGGVWYTIWQHGWTNANEIVSKSVMDYNRGQYINGEWIGGWQNNNDDGSGLTIRNEREVEAKKIELKTRDWSHHPQTSN